MDVNVVFCAECGFTALPPKYVCPRCRSNQLELHPRSGKGTIYSHTTIHIAPEPHATNAPYAVILVELEDGLRLTARLSEGKPHIGQQVELSRVEDSIYWFLPVI